MQAHHSDVQNVDSSHAPSNSFQVMCSAAMVTGALTCLPLKLRREVTWEWLRRISSWLRLLFLCQKYLSTFRQLVQLTAIHHHMHSHDSQSKVLTVHSILCVYDLPVPPQGRVTLACIPCSKSYFELNWQWLYSTLSFGKLRISIPSFYCLPLQSDFWQEVTGGTQHKMI